ncbi:MAG: hypothetical protein WBA83_16895 [Burkholderiaceae bacterium]
MDPMLVLERKQEQAARSKPGKQERARQGIEALFKRELMTQDESEHIEELLLVWYRYERAYMPALGAPRVSVSCKGHDPGEIHDDGDDRDAKLARATAEAVEACVDELPVMQRAAIGVHMRNRTAGMSVHRSPRIEDKHQAYQEAKLALWPKLKRKGLMR